MPYNLNWMSKKHAISKYWTYLLFNFLVITPWSLWCCEFLGRILVRLYVSYALAFLENCDISNTELPRRKQHPHSLTLPFQRQSVKNLPFLPPDVPSSCSLPWDLSTLHLRVPKHWLPVRLGKEEQWESARTSEREEWGYSSASYLSSLPQPGGYLHQKSFSRGSFLDNSLSFWLWGSLLDQTWVPAQFPGVLLMSSFVNDSSWDSLTWLSICFLLGPWIKQAR